MNNHDNCISTGSGLATISMLWLVPEIKAPMMTTINTVFCFHKKSSR